MTLTLMHTKLQKPQLPEPLIHKDHRLTMSQINIICAQAGSGKSTLVSQWLTVDQQPFIWYALDEWDNELYQFLAYLAEGYKLIHVAEYDQMNQLLSAQNTFGDAGIIKAFVALMHRVNQPVTLVLDDYHHISEDQVHLFMKALLDHMPPLMRLCLLTREDPPLPLARLRTLGVVSEIRLSDLRFSLEETTSFFEARLVTKLSPAQIMYLHTRTEGWVAGLQLTALSLQSVVDVDTFISDFSNSHFYIMDYLLEEVLNNQSPNVRDFLLRSSIFEYFSSALCDHVFETAPGESQVIIDALIKKNAFLMTVHTEHRWHRYHHLFRALLRKRFDQTDKKEAQRLHQKAGQWFESADRIQEAIEHYLNGELYELAAERIENKWAVMDLELRSSTWLELAKKLPLSLINRSPILTMGYGWALLDQGDVVSCLPWFEHAQILYDRWQNKVDHEEILIYDHEEFMQLPATLMSAKAYIAAVHGDYDQLFEATKALETLAIDHVYKRQWVVETFVATGYWGQGNLDLAIKSMMRVIEMTRGVLSPLVQQSMIWVLGDLYIQKGQLNKAELLLEHAIETVMQEGIVPVLLATYYLHLAMIATVKGDYEKATAHLELSESYGHQFEFLDWRYKFFAWKARLYHAQGAWDQAKICIETGQKITFQNPIPDYFTVEDLKIWIALESETDEHLLKARALALLKSLKGEKGMMPAYTDEMQWKVLLKYVPIDADTAYLEGVCQRLKERAASQNRRLHVIEFSLLLMRFAKSESMKQTLYKDAKQLAEGEGIRLPFIEFMVSPYESLANQRLAEPLTPRELEILTLIEKGFSNQEIGDTLFIALNTVKSYNNSLFGKLDVKRRTEAIAKAKALGIL